jgi:hypothetical protein
VDAEEGTMIDKLTEAECEITECVARRLNVVIAAVEALQRQFEQHIAAEDGADPVEGKDVCPKCGGSGMIYCGWGEAEYCECRRDWKKEYEDAEEAIGGLVDERDELRAERAALQARVAKLEKEDTERLERGREKARHMEKEIATLKHAVRGALENLAYGQIWTPYDTQYVRDAIAALRAALGDGGEGE